MADPLLAAMVCSDVWASVPKRLFQIQVPSKDWTLLEKPMPGVEAVAVRASDPEKGIRPNITLVHDTTAALYVSHDQYVRDAIQVLREQGAQKVISIVSEKSKGAGKYTIIFSRKGDADLVQAIYFKKGLGHYVVTASAAHEAFPKLAKDFDQVIRTARFQ